jgi:hypothetical protein
VYIFFLSSKAEHLEWVLVLFLVCCCVCGLSVVFVRFVDLEHLLHIYRDGPTAIGVAILSLVCPRFFDCSW